MLTNSNRKRQKVLMPYLCSSKTFKFYAPYLQHRTSCNGASKFSFIFTIFCTLCVFSVPSIKSFTRVNNGNQIIGFTFYNSRGKAKFARVGKFLSDNASLQNFLNLKVYHEKVSTVRQLENRLTIITNASLIP